jgi:signal transduction histidine kinase
MSDETPSRKPKRKRRSLRRQLIITITGVHMILMASFVADLTTRQQRFVEERARTRTLYEAGVLAASAAPQVATDDLAGLQDVVTSVVRDTSIRWAAVTDEKGKVLSDSDPRHTGEYLKDTTSVGILKGRANAKIFNEGTFTVSAVAPIALRNHVLGWAWVTSDLAAERGQVIGLRRTGFIYTVAAILCGALFAIVLANRMTRQLRLLLAGTTRVAHDNLDEPVPIVADNEVGTVARAFNSAMNALKRERAAHLRARADLEAEVRERRRAQQELTEANQAMTTANDSLRQFAYAASHDLQEPLRGVAAYSELLKKRYGGRLDADANEFIGFIHSGAERMQQLVRGLLEYSRAGGPGEEHASDVNAEAALTAAMANLSVAIEASGAQVMAPELPHVRAHEMGMVQLFQNLIANAIKYAGGNVPEIRISAVRSDRNWIFSVEDNGLGVPVEQQKRIFGIFKRAHGPEYPGTGVGLAICTKIVERYGGRIWVESEPGHGATFKFTVPASESAAAQSSDAA